MPSANSKAVKLELIGSMRLSSKVWLTCIFKLNFLFASCMNRHITVLLGSGCSHSFRGILSELVLAIAPSCCSDCISKTLFCRCNKEYYSKLPTLLSPLNILLKPQNSLSLKCRDALLPTLKIRSRDLVLHIRVKWAEAYLVSLYGWALHCFSSIFLLTSSPCHRLSADVCIILKSTYLAPVPHDPFAESAHHLNRLRSNTTWY